MSKRRSSRRHRSRKPKSSETQNAGSTEQKTKVTSQKRSTTEQEKRYSTLEEFLGQDEIQKLPNTLKVSKLADSRTKAKDQVVISTSCESKGFTYFFDVHDHAGGQRNLTIIQSSPTEKGGFRRQKIAIDGDVLPKFLDELRKVIGFFVV